MILEGQNAIALSRQMIGATDPLNAATGSIRGDYTLDKQANLIHGSDSPEAAQRELALWFPEAQ
jgi:nucleoside-diphosphate kinase